MGVTSAFLYEEQKFVPATGFVSNYWNFFAYDGNTLLLKNTTFCIDSDRLKIIDIIVQMNFLAY